MNPFSPEADCFPLDGVMDVPGASAQVQSEMVRARSANLAREVLARAEDEVRDLLALDLPAAEWTHRSGDIVALAQREVSEILARGRAEAEVADGHTPAPLSIDEPAADAHWLTKLAARDVPESANVVLDGDGRGTAPPAEYFASLRVLPLPSEENGLRYQVSGRLTLATLLAFQQAVSHLPGVNSAIVDPHPDDLAVLTMMTDDSSLVQRLLVSMPGIHLQMEAA